MRNTENIIKAIQELTRTGYKCRLIDVHYELVRRFGVYLDTTAISAEIRRSCRPALATKSRGWLTIDNHQKSPLQKVHVYWIRKMTKEEIQEAMK